MSTLEIQSQSSGMMKINEEMIKSASVILNYPWHDRVFYTNWLSQFYFFVLNATRMIPFAASKFSANNKDIHQRLIAHAFEEVGHEELIIQDLKNLNYDTNNLSELPSTYILSQIQFRLLDHAGPFSFFGISIFMESLSLFAGKPILNTLIEKHGESSCRFVIEHIKADDHHVDEVVSIINKLNHDELEQVVKGFYVIRLAFLQMLEGVQELSSNGQKLSYPAIDLTSRSFADVNF